MRRVLIIALAGCVGLYITGALAGFLFVRYVRKNEYIGFMDVALLRWGEVRKTMAAQQLLKAREDAKAGDLQSAFLAYNFAVGGNPDDVEGRLEAVEFLKSIGSFPLAVSMLEGGLARRPDDPRLIDATFSSLLSGGRDVRALELLSRRASPTKEDPNRLRLLRYHLTALLNSGQDREALQLLSANADLETDPLSQVIVARIRWQNQERLRALELLSRHVQKSDASLPDFAQLMSWQLLASLGDDAIATARSAVQRFDGRVEAHLMLVEATGVHRPNSREWSDATLDFLRRFGEQPKALIDLGGLSARRGWIEMARTVYELSALRVNQLGMFAFFYSDALVKNGRFREANAILAQVETQSAEANPVFVGQLRHRQVIVAAALGDMVAARDHARRLAALLRNNPDSLDVSRRHFQQLGLAVAVAELTARGPANSSL